MLTNAASVAVSPDGAARSRQLWRGRAELSARDPDTARSPGCDRTRASMRQEAAQAARRGVLAERVEVYAAAADLGSLVAFDVGDGGLRPVSVTTTPAPTPLRRHARWRLADGAHVYVAGYGHNAIAPPAAVASMALEL
jgi:hypothetical protein